MSPAFTLINVCLNSFSLFDKLPLPSLWKVGAMKARAFLLCSLLLFPKTHFNFGKEMSVEVLHKLSVTAAPSFPLPSSLTLPSYPFFSTITTTIIITQERAEDTAHSRGVELE